MLFEKNTLFGLLVPWFTGCSAVSPGHLPFWARASISVPGAPASSLATGSQVLVLNPGVEICVPVCVATALLCTVQPPAPRSETSLAPGPEGELSWRPAVRAGSRTRPWGWAAAGVPGALEASQARVVADAIMAAQRAPRGRMARLRMVGNSCPAVRDRERRLPAEGVS